MNDALRDQYIEEIACYVRVSHDESKLHGLSLDAQALTLKKYAEEHNLKIVEWYRDEGVSGRIPIEKRPELQRMIHDAEKRKFKRIIFIKLDRFFRSVAEYHECMKRLSAHGVIWTATEEPFDLSTASGEAFVNMKLTMAQFEADQVGERIRMINEYKIQTGQPLFGSGSFPFCYEVGHPDNGDRHKYVKKRDEEIMRDLIDQVFKKKSVRAGVIYINTKYKRAFAYNSILSALRNEMIYGSYRGNPNYCEPYISKEEFDELQTIIKRSPRTSQSEHTYIFTGLVKCPQCGRRLSGAVITNTDKRYGETRKYYYYGYRCHKFSSSLQCDFTLVLMEKRLETELLSRIDAIVAEKRAKVIAIHDGNSKVSMYDVEALQQELSRLNYSWQKGRIKSVDEYDKRYDELMAQINAANEETHAMNSEPDYEKIQQILSGNWKEIYSALDPEHKRAFWRSFIDEIHVEWTKKVKRISDIIFF